ncbi:MAG: M23 family metallopeptidase [Ruminococcaceae bacterium]|nr:M23 family metallopeptidase [Oscillospiraceae bacterium]
MEKKFKFSDSAAISKIIYLTVIAILCVSAIVIGIVAANNRKKNETPEPPNDGTVNDNGESTPPSTDNSGGSSEENKRPELTFVSPATGTVMKSHSTTVPVFSVTLDEWRIHTGLDISTDDGAEVFAAADGTVTSVYNDPMLGKTVEITHSDTHKSYYSNLNGESVCVAVGAAVSQGDVIGSVGNSSVYEIADEPHLHFEMKVNGVSVNPLDYFTAESKESALGIVK